MALIRLVFILGFVGNFAWAADYPKLGVAGGFSFPKWAFVSLDYNLQRRVGAFYQASFGSYWTIHELGGKYYFSRSDWSPYTGGSLAFWSFRGISSTFSQSGLPIGGTDRAISLAVPLGLIYIAETGFSFDIRVALSIFIDAPSSLAGRLYPEGQIGVGYYFN